jgi:large subunit ribosomal protein L7/L12
MDSQHLIALGEAIAAMDKFVDEKLDEPQHRVLTKQNKLVKVAKQVIEDVEEVLGENIEELQAKMNRAFNELIKAEKTLADVLNAYSPCEDVRLAHGALKEAMEQDRVNSTTFAVILKEIGANKIGVIKEVRAAVPGLGLAEAKTLVESAPKVVRAGVTQEEADGIKQKFEAAGATVEVK